MNKPVETRWFYHGPDNKPHGPFPAKSMLEWVRSGYFQENLPVKTEHEEAYHTLGEWTRVCGGKCPFMYSVASFDMLVVSMSPAPLMVVPPGLAPPYPPPMRYPNGAYVNMPANNGCPRSQPPSEPIDTGSLCHTPDSDHDVLQVDSFNPNNVLRHVSVMTAPQTKSVGTMTESNTKKNAECQTTPIILPSIDAARMLSEMIGLKIHIT